MHRSSELETARPGNGVRASVPPDDSVPEDWYRLVEPLTVEDSPRVDAGQAVPGLGILAPDREAMTHPGYLIPLRPAVGLLQDCSTGHETRRPLADWQAGDSRGPKKRG